MPMAKSIAVSMHGEHGKLAAILTTRLGMQSGVMPERILHF